MTPPLSSIAGVGVGLTPSSLASRRSTDPQSGETPKSQLVKTARRHAFLEAHAARLQELLSWPVGAAVELQIEDLYVCPRIFQFVRRTPRPVPTKFVRLGKQDTLLGSNEG